MSESSSKKSANNINKNNIIYSRMRARKKGHHNLRHKKKIVMLCIFTLYILYGIYGVFVIDYSKKKKSFTH